MIQIVEKRKIPFIISSVLFLLSVFFLVVYGLKPGIDFTGGTLMQVRFAAERPSVEMLQETLASFDVGAVNVQPVEEDGYLLKMRFITEEEHQKVLTGLRNEFPVSSEGESATVSVFEERLETIGPAISSELQKRSIEVGIAVVLAIVIFVAYGFRKVSRPVSSWKFGVIAVVALIHDVTITMGIFALLGHFKGVEIDIPFIVALLTILGYSVNDTIVVFDRIREKLIQRGYDNFSHTVNTAVNDTLARSINTGLTTLLVLIALFFFGGASIHYFALALIIGIVFGGYSSIFLASPLLVSWELFEKRKK